MAVGANMEFEKHMGLIIDHVNGFDIIECIQCGFVHANPIPVEQDLKEIYQEEYYSTEKPEYIARYEEDKQWWELCYDDRYDYFEQQLNVSQRSILDVGSGPGLFLRRGVDRGWLTFGIEPSRQAAEYSRGFGLEIYQGFLAPETELNTFFDVVHLSEVLEHIPNPLALLKKTYSLLNNEGLICIVVPNDYNPLQKALRKVDDYQPWWLAPPHHINYFEPSTLKALVEQAGFEVTEITSTFPIDLFLLMGDNYIDNDVLGRQCHAKRKRFELLLHEAGLNDLRQSLYKQFAQHNVGREIVLYGKKK
jgi:SAM-dependent methyltransferase